MDVTDIVRGAEDDHYVQLYFEHIRSGGSLSGAQPPPPQPSLHRHTSRDEDNILDTDNGQYS